MSNTFANAEYRFGGWGAGTSQLTSTGNYVDSNTLETRGGTVSPVSCDAGRIVAKPGYKVSVYFLTSQNTESITVSGSTKIVYVDVITSDPDYKKWDNVKIAPAGTKYACISVKKDSGAAFTQSEINNLYGAAFVFISNEKLARAVYSAGGDMVVNQSNRYVQIDALKKQHPNYTDDQLLEEAILIARACGGATKILWDGSNIYFAGSVTHVCYGFGGIDFNGSKIVMPNYNVYSILLVVPDDATEVTAQYSEITKDKITNASLLDKIFTLNDNYSGNADMCLGNRIGYEDDIYYTPTIKTSVDGFIETGELYLTPASDTVTCYNVHSYPAVTFELCNGVIVTNAGEHLSLIVQCLRSNTHFHNFTLRNRSTAAERRRGIAEFKYCYGIEVDHISGVNPIQKSISGGYVLALYSVSNLYVHDVSLGDSVSWGVVGGNHLTNSVYERCYMNRWDCHYAQYGTHIIRDCKLNEVAYGKAGYGFLMVENTILSLAKATNGNTQLVNGRSDLVGVYNGDIVFKHCIFDNGEQPAAQTRIMMEYAGVAKPSNSKITGSPEKRRIFKDCIYPAGLKSIFLVGSTIAADMALMENLSYEIDGGYIESVSDVIAEVSTGAQPIDSIKIKNCKFGVDVYITKAMTKTKVVIDGCDFETNTAKVTSNDNSIIVSDTVMKNIVSDQASEKLIMTGCNLSGVQSVSNFTAYALAGNIASDMASVNKHS